MTTNRLTQHIPGFINTDALPPIYEFENSLEGLMNTPLVKRWITYGEFIGLRKNIRPQQIFLLVLYTDEYWTIGYLDMDVPNLPVFSR